MRELLRRYDDHDVLTFASALSFRIVYSVIPLVLFGLGLVGGLGLQDQWSSEWAPVVKDAVSGPMFEVIDGTARRVLGERQTFWISGGLLLAVWAASSAMRTIMDAFERIYGSRRERSFTERTAISLLLGLAVAVLVLAAVGCATLGDDALRSLGADVAILMWLRWAVALALLCGVVALLVAYAPAERRPVRWVSTGTALAVAAWFGTSLLLGWYVTRVADYGSVYGALATVVIFLTYVYIASVAFLTGVEVDDLLQDRSQA